MKSSYIGIAAIMLVMIAVVFAGCTSQTTPAASGGSTPASSSAAAASSSQQVGSTVSSTSIFGTSYSWMEYQTTVTGADGKEMSMDMKTQRSTSTYNGQPAVEMKVTMTSSNMNGVYDYYYDSAMNSILGGTMTMTVNGKSMTMNIPAAQLNQAGATNFNKATTLTFEGIGPVTVPAGTYPAASKYLSSENNGTVTFWSAPGVPVPVQIAVSTSNGGAQSELVGWG